MVAIAVSGRRGRHAFIFDIENKISNIENKIGKIDNEIGNIDNKPSLVVFLGFFDDQNNQAVVLTFCGL